MSEMKFVPQGKLEKAIAEKRNALTIRLAVEADSDNAKYTTYLCPATGGYGLKRPDILATGEFFSLPIRTAATVFACGMNYRLREEALVFMKRNHPESEVIGLMEDVKSVPKGKPSADEDELMRAVTDGDDRRILRLIAECGILLAGMSSERCAALCRALPALEPRTAVALFAEGIHYASVPSLLKFLLRECERPCNLKEMDYRGRLMYANLLIHILQEEIAPADDDLISQDWYPMGCSVANCRDQDVYCRPFSYYYDPRHIYEPRFADGEYEQPKHIIH